jgi:hypothetical protein
MSVNPSILIPSVITLCWATINTATTLYALIRKNKEYMLSKKIEVKKVLEELEDRFFELSTAEHELMSRVKNAADSCEGGIQSIDHLKAVVDEIRLASDQSSELVKISKIVREKQLACRRISKEYDMHNELV